MPHPASRRFRAVLGLLFATFALIAVPQESDARSSGGYSRPSFRTPSVSRGGSGFRTPSFSGGYSRPSVSRRSYAPPSSAGDRSFSEGRSSAALNAFRAQQDTARQRRAAPAPSYRTPSPSYAGNSPNRSSWLGNRGWSAPPPAYYGGRRSFGVWDGLFLGALLSNLTRPGNAEFFHNNQNDPGYREWRAQVDQQAKNDPELRQKLGALDQQLAEKSNQPRDPGALPPDVPADVAKAAPARTPGVPEGGGGTSGVIIVVLIGAAGLAFLAWRRHAAAGGGSSMSPPKTALGSAANMLRHKLSGEGYAPDKFRVGMTLQLDPTPFILAGDKIKAPQPEGTGSGQISVSAIGQVQSGGARLTRLYLPDNRSLVQLHLGPGNDPDECRLFATIDEVTPADPNEWGAWLDPREGMIGWPVFQTKDGKTYGRAWVPGDSRVTPRAITETIEGLDGTRTVQSQAMLYAAPTGAADPAPPTEYIMVAAVQDAGRAWVEIRAGIDINPVTLQLA